MDKDRIALYISLGKGSFYLIRLGGDGLGENRKRIQIILRISAQKHPKVCIQLRKLCELFGKSRTCIHMLYRLLGGAFPDPALLRLAFTHGIAGVFVYHCDHYIGDMLIKLGAPALYQLTPDRLLRHDLTVAAVAGHGIIGIGHGYDPCLFGDLCPLQAVRIAPAVDSFVMPPGSVGKPGHFLYVYKDPVSYDGVLFDLSKFLIGEPAGLVYDPVRNPDLSHIMQKPHHIDLILTILIIPHPFCHLPGIGRHTARMTVGIGILGIYGLRKGLDNMDGDPVVFPGLLFHLSCKILTQVDKLYHPHYAQCEDLGQKGLSYKVDRPQLQSFCFRCKLLVSRKKDDRDLIFRPCLLTQKL